MNYPKTVTVVGANGTMGANVSAIFASFGSATVYMVARDKERSEGQMWLKNNDRTK